MALTSPQFNIRYFISLIIIILATVTPSFQVLADNDGSDLKRSRSDDKGISSPSPTSTTLHH